MLTMNQVTFERVADVWDERLQALDNLMYAMTSDYDTLSLPRWDTLKPVLKCLHAYGRGQFNYFHDGFGSGRLEMWDNYPPESVYSIVLNQIGYDLEVIQRAVEQRVSGSAATTATLKETDKLAWLALKPAIDAGLLPADTTIVTYFQKSPVSRVIPYAPVALIGVPYTCTAVVRDHLAIPHEVGHYIFWHARLPETGEPLHQVLRQRAFEELKAFVQIDSLEFPKWCYAWLEELFADVYGALIGGPVMALNFQDISLHHSCEEFTTSDNDHPVPIIRPDIYAKVLQKAATTDNQWGAWADRLQQRWQLRRVRCGGSNYFTADGESIMMRDAISIGRYATDDKPLDRMIFIALELLGGIQTDWSGETDLAGAIEGLYDSQRAYLPSLLADVTQSLDPSAQTATQWLKRAQDLMKAEHSQFVTAEVWRQRFIADGWTTEGPDTRWP
ncbi:MAG: hypothetical protein U0559_10055 [Anaerolineae bacterium]